MTAIVNNARFSSNRGGNFQRSFLSFLSWRISQNLNVNDNYCPRCEWELWTLFSLFSLESNVADPGAERGLWLKHNEGGVFFSGRVWRKRGQESKWEWHLPSAEACFVPAIDASFPKVSLQGGRSALQIGSAVALFTSGQAGRGMVPTHTPSVIPTHWKKKKSPTPSTSLLTSVCLNGPNLSRPAFLQADSPEQAHTVGALFQQQGLGRVRVKGRRRAALTGSK